MSLTFQAMVLISSRELVPMGRAHLSIQSLSSLGSHTRSQGSRSLGVEGNDCVRVHQPVRTVEVNVGSFHAKGLTGMLTH